MEKERKTLPLLPMRGVVVFPYMMIHIDVGRKRSMEALEAAMAEDREVVLVAQRDEEMENPAPEDLYEIGTVAEVNQLIRLPGDSVRVLVEGKKRARVCAFRKGETYDEADVEAYEDEIDKSMEREALTRAVVDKFEEWVRLSKKIPPEAIVSVAIIEDGGRLADLIASHLNLKTKTRQEILEAIDVQDRLELLFRVLEREIEILQIEAQIGKQVKKQMDKIQRDYYLRERMKAIRKELGTSDGFSDDIEAYEHRLESGNYPEDVEKTIRKELHRLEGMSNMNQEASVIRTYVDWLLDLPWNHSTEDNLDLDEAKKVLDHDHYGLEKVKDRILDYLAVHILAKDKSAPILCLVGPPGVGKTSLAASIARATGRKFVRASLGGIRDEAEIRGHRRTYVGAMPGRVIEGIKNAGANNPVFLLDEVDKLDMDYRGDPSAALLEVLDPAQNRTFSDHYIELPFDLSKVFWVVTANDLGAIPRALRDRMEILELSSYTDLEKREIAKRYLYPRQRRENGLKAGDIRIAAGAIEQMIEDYTRESGVRELERVIGKACRKAARQLVEGAEAPIRISKKNLTDFLGKVKFVDTKANRKPEVGLVTGMAWTQVGGTILPVEAAVLPGTGKMQLTGQLGDVMKESAQAGLTYVRSRAKKLGLKDDFYEKNDLHIHLPEGAIPKDGPSAGITMATAMVSALTKRKVRCDIAMTGEITLRGKVLPIGGLKEKVLAAYREGIRNIILPKENERDIEDIPAFVRGKITFFPVEDVDEVLKLALLPKADKGEK
ncbi:MAG: endopeptidase La [Selenomonadaceae bacterium]|nr:endopeptidase La [Selenomonadaceae bacterium]